MLDIWMIASPRHATEGKDGRCQYYFLNFMSQYSEGVVSGQKCGLSKTTQVNAQ